MGPIEIVSTIWVVLALSLAARVMRETWWRFR